MSDGSAISDGNGMSDRSESSDGSRISDSGAGRESQGDSPSPLIWFADHENADLSAWHTGGAAVGGGQYGAGQTEISRERAHGGSHSVKLTIDTTDGADRTARLFRRTVSGGAYYSAWFFWSEAYTPSVWWSIFLFRAQTDANDLNTYVNLWDINVERPSNGNMTISFYDHLTDKKTFPSMSKPLPVGQWTHIEAYFNYVPPSSTRITIWQDGDVVLDLAGLGQGPSPYFYWSVGTGSNGLVPRVSSTFLDDAVISRVRTGPAGGG